ncbi:hypothetical protein PCE1_004118 [Barthelona sp. PCE]
MSAEFYNINLRGVSYRIVLKCLPNSLFVYLEDVQSKRRWKGEFIAQMIVEYVALSGLNLTFDQFVSQLRSACLSEQQNLKVDVLSDRELKKIQQQHQKDVSNVVSDRMYVIFIHVSPDASIHFPLPLNPTQTRMNMGGGTTTRPMAPKVESVQPEVSPVHTSACVQCSKHTKELDLMKDVLRKERTKFRHQIDVLREEIAALTQSLKDAQLEESQPLRDIRKQLAAAKRELKSQEEGDRKQIVSLRRKVKKLRAETEDLRRENERMAVKNRIVSKKNKELKAKMDELQGRVSRLSRKSTPRREAPARSTTPKRRKRRTESSERGSTRSSRSKRRSSVSSRSSSASSLHGRFDPTAYVRDLKRKRDRTKKKLQRDKVSKISPRANRRSKRHRDDTVESISKSISKTRSRIEKRMEDNSASDVSISHIGRLSELGSSEWRERLHRLSMYKAPEHHEPQKPVEEEEVSIFSRSSVNYNQISEAADSINKKIADLQNALSSQVE